VFFIITPGFVLLIKIIVISAMLQHETIRAQERALLKKHALPLNPGAKIEI
jgi:hypothetical protein